MTSFEWFLLIVVVIGVPLIIAIVVTLWTIDQANKRKRQNRADPQIGVKRTAALSPDEAAARRAARTQPTAPAPDEDVPRETSEPSPDPNVQSDDPEQASSPAPDSTNRSA